MSPLAGTHQGEVDGIQMTGDSSSVLTAAMASVVSIVFLAVLITCACCAKRKPRSPQNMPSSMQAKSNQERSSDFSGLKNDDDAQSKLPTPLDPPPLQPQEQSTKTSLGQTTSAVSLGPKSLPPKTAVAPVQKSPIPKVAPPLQQASNPAPVSTPQLQRSLKQEGPVPAAKSSIPKGPGKQSMMTTTAPQPPATVITPGLKGAGKSTDLVKQPSYPPAAPVRYDDPAYRTMIDLDDPFGGSMSGGFDKGSGLKFGTSRTMKSGMKASAVGGPGASMLNKTKTMGTLKM